MAAFDRLVAADPTGARGVGCARPGCFAWRRPCCIKIGPSVAATLLQGGAKRRTADGIPPAVVQSTARHSGGEGPAVIELTRDRFLSDPATGDILYPLRALVNDRLSKKPRDAGLLELRAELAGQWSDARAQVADYTAAIAALSQHKPAAPAADLQRLHVRRGNAYVSLRQWQQAVDDYARVVTDATTDVDLLSKRARAYGALKNWDAAAADWRGPRPEIRRAWNCSPSLHVSLLPAKSFRWAKFSLKSLRHFTNDRWRRILKTTRSPPGWLKCCWISKPMRTRHDGWSSSPSTQNQTLARLCPCFLMAPSSSAAQIP